MKKFAVILYGPPGSGKGTQAKLLSDKFNFFHFDTGDFLRGILYDFKNRKNKKIQKEKKLNESGELNTPLWVLDMVSKRVKELAALKQSILFSGSPRTIFETFGNKKYPGLITLLKKLYGQENIFVFVLKIPESESIKRNSSRSVCSVCKIPLIGKAPNVKRRESNCPFCGGKIVRRRDDKKEIITGRLKEYRLRTQPIFNELKKLKYKVIFIDGTPMPYKVHQKIAGYF